MVFVDSSVLIHLSRIGKLNLLKEYFKEIKITEDVFEETVVKSGEVAGKIEIKRGCDKWIKIEKPKNAGRVRELSRNNLISKADASLIESARERKEILLTNDYLLIKVARSFGVECWWLTTFIIKCREKNVLTKSETKKIVIDLIESGMRLNIEVYTRIEKIIDEMK
ncbi:MAG: hypothetical protein ABIE23_03935 [archaeon]|nr:hypothetical protein [Candidatus Micrarchaeota archaeon]